MRRRTRSTKAGWPNAVRGLTNCMTSNSSLWTVSSSKASCASARLNCCAASKLGGRVPSTGHRVEALQPGAGLRRSRNPLASADPSCPRSLARSEPLHNSNDTHLKLRRDEIVLGKSLSRSRSKTPANAAQRCARASPLQSLAFARLRLSVGRARPRDSSQRRWYGRVAQLRRARTRCCCGQCAGCAVRSLEIG